MSARRNLKLSLLALLVVAGGVAVCLFAYARRQPSYQGKPLAYWFGQLPATLVTPNPSGASISAIDGVLPANVALPQEQAGECIRAIQTIGPDALPFLLAKLQSRDTAMKRRIQDWATKVGVKRQLFATAWAEQGRAVTALVALQPLPDNALNQLRALSTNSHRQIAAAANWVLANPWSGMPLNLNNDPTTIKLTNSITR